MVPVAQIGFGDIVLSLVIVFFMTLYLIAFFGVITDLFRSDDLSRYAKAAWALALLLVPFVSLLVYLILRGDGMAERLREHDRAREQRVGTAPEARPHERGDGIAQVAEAKRLLDEGALTVGEFEAVKRKALD